MSERLRRADPDLCWNCGKRGRTHGACALRTCSECEVTWMPGRQPIANFLS
jgi:hypothetical protein